MPPGYPTLTARAAHAGLASWQLLSRREKGTLPEFLIPVANSSGLLRRKALDGQILRYRVDDPDLFGHLPALDGAGAASPGVGARAVVARVRASASGASKCATVRETPADRSYRVRIKPTQLLLALNERVGRA